MSDLTPSEPLHEPAVPSGAQEIEVDLAAFLPDGVELGEETVLDDDTAVLEDDVVVVATEDGIVAVEEVVMATEDGVVVIDEVVAVVEAEAPAAPAVDLEALSQIERDLDAVDAAIAALDAGTYGTDPVTGQPIDDALLAENPTRLS